MRSKDGGTAEEAAGDARAWLRRAAEQGYVPAASLLGTLQVVAPEGEADWHEAGGWLERVVRRFLRKLRHVLKTTSSSFPFSTRR